MAAKLGKNCKVTLGSDKVLGMGTYKLPGVTSEIHEDTEFGDDWKTFLLGLKDGGEVAFNGYYDPADSTGQDVLRTANENGTEVTNIRFYIDATSYWTPKTTGPASHVLVTAWDIDADKSGIMPCSFTCKVSGQFELI
jgi:hypothetical protein